MKSFKILHCVAGNLYGGVEVVLQTLARARDLVPRLDHEFAACFEGRLTSDLRASGSPVHLLGPVRFGRPWTLLPARRRLREVLAHRRPSVLVGHASWPYAAFAPVARRAGIPAVFWMHDAATGSHWLERLARRTPPDLILANSHHTASTAPRLFPGQGAEILYCPVEPPPPLDRPRVRSEVRAELNTAPDDVVLVTACRLEPWKGHALLLDALGRLADRPGWTLWVAGGVQRPHEQTYLDALKAQAARLNLSDRVLWLGQRPDVRRLLAAADIHCQPNTGAEPFGIAFIEALYAGLPVVSTRLGGAVEIVNETCGRLVEPGDPAALSDALRPLLADPDLRSTLGAAGPPRASLLSDPARILERLLGLLAPLVEAESRTPPLAEDPR